MKRVNVLWPKKLETEYLHLCDEFYSTITDDEAEDESLFFEKQEAYINANATSALRDWIKHVESLKNESA